MRRRQFLTSLGATGIALGVAGCVDLGGGPSGPATDGALPTVGGTDGGGSARLTPDEAPPRADRFGTVVDLQQAGVDGTATTSIAPTLREQAGDDTLLFLPPGRYLLDEGIQFLDFENLGIVGRGATITAPPEFEEVYFDLGRPGRASGLLFEGITFDFRDPGTGSRALSALVDDDLVVRDVAIVGTQTDGNNTARMDVTDPEGRGVVERLQLADGASFDTQSNGCVVGDEHRGLIRFKDCHIEGFPDNGLYADPTEGRVQVFGGYYANCNVSCLRVANDSYVRGAHVRCDRAPSEYGNMRGIRLTHARGARVEDCTVEMLDVTGSDGGITFGKSLHSASVKNTDVTVDVGEINGIQVKNPVDVPGDGRIDFENVSVAGSAANGVAIEVNERKNCHFRDCTVQQTGRNRDGIRFDDGSDGSIRNSRIEVTGRPIVTTENSTIRVIGSFPPSINTSTRG